MTRLLLPLATTFSLKSLSASMALITVLGLTACGGGSSGTTNTSNTGSGRGEQGDATVRPELPNKGSDNSDSSTGLGGYTLKGDVAKHIRVGESAGFLAVQKQSQDADFYEWKVLSPNANKVRISASHQPASSFTFLAPGTYSLQFTAQKRNQYNQLKPVATINYQVKVSADKAQASLKADRAARSGATVNLYFDTGTSIDSNEWQIRQIQGATAKITRGDDGATAVVSLPETNHEQVLVFEAQLKSNPAVKDSAYVLLQPTNGSSAPYFCQSPSSGAYCLPTTPLNHHYAYKAKSPVADILADCVMSYQVNEGGMCHLAYLPFIGQVNPEPSIDDIMDRVVVSHDWMAKNFELFLRQYDRHDDFKRLLRSATAIVISDNVKPSFYWGGTGTMYLSADYLWMTPEQRAVLSSPKDYRAQYMQTFDYLFDFDYERNKQSVMFNSDYYPSLNKGRSLETIALPLASLLYHELAHANDYFPQQQLHRTDGYSIAQLAKLAPYELISDSSSVSNDLTSSYPLTNGMLKGLAQVWYGGRTPTAIQLNYQGEQVADAYFTDRANDEYGYYTAQEDVAMLFEEAMMLTRFGVNRYSMLMDNSQSVPTIIRGQKNRISDPMINNRVNLVTAKILPEVALEVSRTLDSMQPTELCVGSTYFEYYDTDCRQPNLAKPQAMKYRQLMQRQNIDEFGRPQGAPRHHSPQVLLPPDFQ